MHFAFIPYGKRSEVELLFRDMEAQKHFLKISKDGVEKGMWIQSQIRLMPFGIVEYVFPKEDVDIVLNTLIGAKGAEDRYNLNKFFMGVVRKMLRLKPIPEYKKEKKMLWIKDNVNIIPLGIREDTDITDDHGDFIGWTHEAI